jgi:spore coat protein U-like protein
MTLTEVMIGACVLVLVLGGSLLVMQRNYRLLAAARDLNFATQMLQNEVEHMRLASWSTVSGYATTATTLPLDAAFANHPQVGSRFTLTRTKSVVQSDLLELTYTIRWTGSDGQTISRTIRAGYAQNGLYDWYYSGI